MRIFFSLLFLLFLSSPASSTLEFPSPKGTVNDFAQIIDDRQEKELENFLRDFWKKYGVALVVVTFPEVGSEPLAEVATRLFNTWDIGGSEGKGVLLLLSQRDGEAWIEVGYGLGKVLGVGKTRAIIRRYVIPNLHRGDAGTGALLGTLAIAKEIAEAKKAAKPTSSPPLVLLLGILLALVLMILVLSQILRGTGRPLS